MYEYGLATLWRKLWWRIQLLVASPIASSLVPVKATVSNFLFVHTLLERCNSYELQFAYDENTGSM